MNITLNVSGQHFEVQKDTLIKIPYFRDMFDACGDNINEIIPVNRPPHIFKHVLALIIDPLYPFPAKYAFELDFYGIMYNKKYLYDKYQELLDKMNYNHQVLLNKINDMDNNLIKTKTKLKTIKKEIKNIEGISQKGFCYHLGCNSVPCEKSLFCEYHKKCIKETCREMPNSGYNYCIEHYKDEDVCDHGGCDRLRGDTNEYCSYH